MSCWKPQAGHALFFLKESLILGDLGDRCAWHSESALASPTNTMLSSTMEFIASEAASANFEGIPTRGNNNEFSSFHHRSRETALPVQHAGSRRVAAVGRRHLDREDLW